MNNSGPSLEALTHRLAETPSAILRAHLRTEGVYLPALVNDFFVARKFPPQRLLEYLYTGKPDRDTEAQLLIALLALWVLQAPECSELDYSDTQLASLFTDRLPQLAKGTVVLRCVTEPDQREELVRTLLAQLDYRPAGETIAQAKDRLASISSVERQRLIRESRAAEKRAREIREALAKKAAEEAADKWSRE